MFRTAWDGYCAQRGLPPMGPTLRRGLETDRTHPTQKAKRPGYIYDASWTSAAIFPKWMRFNHSKLRPNCTLVRPRDPSNEVRWETIVPVDANEELRFDYRGFTDDLDVTSAGKEPTGDDLP